MIKVIVGGKGTGKTAQLVEDLNTQATRDNANVVCLEVGQRINTMVNHNIRLIDITEYPVKGYEQLLSFIAGIYAKDFDLTHVYIDSIGKISGDSNLTNLEKFLSELDDFSARNDFNVMIILSADPEGLPKGIAKYTA